MLRSYLEQMTMGPWMGSDPNIFFFSFTEKAILTDLDYTDCNNQVGHYKSILNRHFPCMFLWLCATMETHLEWEDLQSSFKDNFLATFWLLCGKKCRGTKTEAEVSTQNQYCNNYSIESCCRIKEENWSCHLKKAVLCSSMSGIPMYDIRHRPNFQVLLWFLLKNIVLYCSGPLLYSDQGTLVLCHSWG